MVADTSKRSVACLFVLALGLTTRCATTPVSTAQTAVSTENAGIASTGAPAMAPAPAPLPEVKQVPLRDFFRNPERTGFMISPGGTYLAYRAPYKTRMNIFVQPIAGGEAIRITEEVARDIQGAFWKGDDRILYVKDFGGVWNVAGSRCEPGPEGDDVCGVVVG